MRTSVRVPGILVGMALALGGVIVCAPSAHADLPACHRQVQQAGFEVTDAVRMACYTGLVGDQGACFDALAASAVPRAAAAEACSLAAE
ncbi:hypothetical protein [Streptomyces adustus]|uniref:hypothetical protein n=1 Tax=Streptomyces adustus TaxID=1609272 RepID=UPI0037178EF6